MTGHPRISVTLVEKELTALRAHAKDRESDSNLVRRKLGLQPLSHGGHRKVFKSLAKQRIKK